MTDKKISQLTGATTPLAGTEVLPIVQSGATVKVSAADLTAGRSISSAGASLDGAVVINESGADVDFRVEGDTNANAFFVQGSDGYVGIGTNAPIDNLDVYGGVTLSTNDSFAVTGSDSTTTQVVFHGFRGGDGDKTGTGFRIRTRGDGAGNASEAIFDTLDTERFRISGTEAVFNDPGADVDFRIESDTDTHAFFLDGANGNVGIGTSSPSSLLNLLSSTADTLLLVQSTFAGGDARLGLTANSAGVSQIRFGDEASENVGMLTYTHADNSMKFRTNAQDRMLITSGGEVYIAGSTDQGAYNLQVNGTGVWGAGAYVNGSDERVKNEITPIASALGVVEKLNPVTYRYKESWSKDQSIQTGFIAQELLTALEGQVYVDGVVQQNEPESYYSVAYQNIIPILTKAIQELKAELDDVKAKIAAS